MGSTKLYPVTSTSQRELESSLSGAYGSILNRLKSGIFSQESPASIAREWGELYATPVMEQWYKNIAPIIEEGFNLPGSFYQSAKSKGIAQAASDYLSGSVTPTLFSALSEYWNRQPQWASIYANVLGQASGQATAQTLVPVTKEKSSSGLGSLIGLGAGLAANAFIPGFSTFLGGAAGLTNLEAGAFGSLIGGSIR